jgi:hypothetical protein
LLELHHAHFFVILLLGVVVDVQLVHLYLYLFLGSPLHYRISHLVEHRVLE